MERKKRKRTAALLIACVLALAAALWFALSPHLEKWNLLIRQNELLESMEQGGGHAGFYMGGGEAEPGGIAASGEDINAFSETVTEELPFVTVSYEAANAVSPMETPTVIDYEVSPAETPAVNYTVSHAEAFPANAETAPSGEVEGIGILEIEKIDAKLPVTEGVTDEQLKIAVGHVPESAPIGGEGNAIIAGHRSYTYGHYFNRLGELESGDVILYQPTSGAEMAFEVFEILEVLPDDPAIYAEFIGERILTLHTCTPVREATHRLLIRAKRIY